MGKSYYLTDLEIKLLNGIMSSVDTLGMGDDEKTGIEALNKLSVKFFKWNQDLNNVREVSLNE